MAFDEYLAQRIRNVVGSGPGIDGKKMFGGLAVLLDGNMAVGVSRDELIVRVDADDFDAASPSQGFAPSRCRAGR